jgi:hypothetical protein
MLSKSRNLNDDYVGISMYYDGNIHGDYKREIT